VAVSTLFEWNKYMNLLHELALVEDDLRSVVKSGGLHDYYQDEYLAQRLLFERFGHDG
jgi:hypothetical protein